MIGIFLLVDVFLGKGYTNPIANFIYFTGKAISVQVLLSLIGVTYARTSIANLTDIGWRLLVPLSLVQFLILILLKGLIV